MRRTPCSHLHAATYDEEHACIRLIAHITSITHSPGIPPVPRSTVPHTCPQGRGRGTKGAVLTTSEVSQQPRLQILLLVGGATPAAPSLLIHSSAPLHSKDAPGHIYCAPPPLSSDRRTMGGNAQWDDDDVRSSKRKRQVSCPCARGMRRHLLSTPARMFFQGARCHLLPPPRPPPQPAPPPRPLLPPRY